MPSIFRRAVGAVKDRTSIGLVKIRPREDLADVEVAVLKATSHDEIPSPEHQAAAVLLLAGGSPESATALLRLLSRRVARTRCWVVALKSALLALRAIQQPSPYFRRAALSSVVGGGAAGVTLLGLSLFSDSSHPTNPWDFTAFVRTFGLYIDALLRYRPYRRATMNPAGMTPAAVLDRIGPSLELLRRAAGTRPTGPARAHRLVKIALYPVIQDTFAVYLDVVDGIAVLLDEFSNLVPPARQEAFRALKMAGDVFDELDNFYKLCQEIGVGRSNEYPAVQTAVPGEILSRIESVIKKDKEELVSMQTKSPSLRLLLAAPPPEKKVDVADLMQFDNDVDNSNEWELALVESVAGSDVSNQSSGDKAKPASATMYNDASLRYNNPFIDEEEEEIERLVAAAPPTFRAKEHAGEVAPAAESDPFAEAGGFSPTSAMAVTSPRQRMIREMQLWRIHQGRIMAANKMCIE